MKNGKVASSKSIAFCHLDLGLGGAERFIVDSALQLQQDGHDVHVLTSFYDVNRCAIYMFHAGWASISAELRAW